MPDAPDPIRADLDQAYSNYTQLAARVEPAQGVGGRRPQPGSRPPLQIQMVSAMNELERFLGWFNDQARWLLNPVQRIELTKREGIRCPAWLNSLSRECGGELLAWLWPEQPSRSEIVCTNVNHDEAEAPRRWPPSEWKRLGVRVGSHEDGRFTVGRDSGVA